MDCKSETLVSNIIYAGDGTIAFTTEYGEEMSVRGRLELYTHGNPDTDLVPSGKSRIEIERNGFVYSYELRFAGEDGVLTEVIIPFEPGYEVLEINASFATLWCPEKRTEYFLLRELGHPWNEIELTGRVEHELMHLKI